MCDLCTVFSQNLWPSWKWVMSPRFSLRWEVEMCEFCNIFLHVCSKCWHDGFTRVNGALFKWNLGVKLGRVTRWVKIAASGSGVILWQRIEPQFVNDLSMHLCISRWRRNYVCTKWIWECLLLNWYTTDTLPNINIICYMWNYHNTQTLDLYTVSVMLWTASCGRIYVNIFLFFVVFFARDGQHRNPKWIWNVDIVDSLL